eukprot:2235797-Amphidinium_carterae.1
MQRVALTLMHKQRRIEHNESSSTTNVKQVKGHVSGNTWTFSHKDWLMHKATRMLRLFHWRSSNAPRRLDLPAMKSVPIRQANVTAKKKPQLNCGQAQE